MTKTMMKLKRFIQDPHSSP